MAATYDVIVIGAGISGMYQLHRLRGLVDGDSRED